MEIFNISQEYFSIITNYTTLSPNRDSSEYIISSSHDGSDISTMQSLNGLSSSFLKFILHNQETQEMQVFFNFISVNFLGLYVCDMQWFPSKSNHTVPTLGVDL